MSTSTAFTMNLHWLCGCWLVAALFVGDCGGTYTTASVYFNGLAVRTCTCTNVSLWVYVIICVVSLMCINYILLLDHLLKLELELLTKTKRLPMACTMTQSMRMGELTANRLLLCNAYYDM